jgi:hypothetical protein
VDENLAYRRKNVGRVRVQVNRKIYKSERRQNYAQHKYNKFDQKEYNVPQLDRQRERRKEKTIL